MRVGTLLAASALLFAVCGTACRRPSDARAVQLVRAYNQKLMEAYRASDERLVEGLVGDEEARKLLGLIGVKADMGMTLDASLVEFSVLGVQRPSREILDVLTEERWHYRDRRIGSGETIGQESDDHYFMRYSLKKQKDRWVVWKVGFERPPEVGRQSAPSTSRPADLHGMTTAPRPDRRPGDSGAASGRSAP